MSELLVTAIICFRDDESYLDEAIRSVLEQTHDPLELVLVDDGSTDDSPAIAAGHRNRARIVSQPPLGVGPARNAGIAAARGDAIAFCDADDLWEPDKVARQVAALDADPQISVVLTMVQEFLSPEIPPERARVRPGPAPLVGALPSALLARRGAFERVGPFDDSRIGQWADWYARLKETGMGIEVLPEVLVRRRVHDTNLGLVARNDRGEYLRALKASLDRRRADA